MDITVKFEGTGKKRDRLLLGDAVSHCQQLVDLLKSMDRTPRRDPVAFEVIKMTKNSPWELAISPFNPQAKTPRPLPSSCRRIRDRLHHALYALDPNDLSEDDIVRLDKLASAARKLARENRVMTLVIEGDEFVIGKSVADMLDEILNVTTSEYGTFTGTLEVVSNRENQAFNLYPLAGPRSIRCMGFTDEQLPDILQHLKERKLVEVEGRLIQRRRSRYPHLIYVSHIEPLDDDEGDSLLAFRGSLKGVEEPEGGWLNAW